MPARNLPFPLLVNTGEQICVGQTFDYLESEICREKISFEVPDLFFRVDSAARCCYNYSVSNYCTERVDAKRRDLRQTRRRCVTEEKKSSRTRDRRRKKHIYFELIVLRAYFPRKNRSSVSQSSNKKQVTNRFRVSIQE